MKKKVAKEVGKFITKKVSFSILGKAIPGEKTTADYIKYHYQ